MKDALRSELDAEEVRKQSNLIRSRLERARATGKTIGRPKKVITKEELALAKEMHFEGYGFRVISNEINHRRGVFSYVLPAVRRRLAISHNTLKARLRQEGLIPETSERKGPKQKRRRSKSDGES